MYLLLKESICLSLHCYFLNVFGLETLFCLFVCFSFGKSHTWLCSGHISSSALRIHSWQTLGDHMGCWGLKLGVYKARTPPAVLLFWPNFVFMCEIFHLTVSSSILFPFGLFSFSFVLGAHPTVLCLFLALWLGIIYCHLFILGLGEDVVIVIEHMVSLVQCRYWKPVNFSPLFFLIGTSPTRAVWARGHYWWCGRDRIGHCFGQSIGCCLA